MRTGIFFYYQDSNRLRDFPAALVSALSRDNVFLYDANYPLKARALYELSPASDDLLFKVHSRRMIEQLKTNPDFPGALFSAGGTIQAAETICKDEIDNAFVFTGYGDHHAGRDFWGGGCYLNGAALAITSAREKYGIKRALIVDTDAHHGDGTWDVFRSDPDVMYLCFCMGPAQLENNKINVRVPPVVTDGRYLKLVGDALRTHVDGFRPDLIFWNYGFDGTRGDYGNIGLSPDCHTGLAAMFRKLADNVCHGRLVVVLCGGSSRQTAAYTIPRIIDRLST